MGRDFGWLDFWKPWLITLASGFATTFGAALVFFIDPKDEKKLSSFLAMSGGVMTYLCFTDMLPEALEHLEEYNKERAKLLQTIFFFGAMVLCVFLEYCMQKLFFDPSNLDPASCKAVEGERDIEACTTAESSPAQRLKEFRLVSHALMAAAAVTMHNFPEGMATFLSSAGNKSYGVATAVALGLHNIPEGLAVALPVLKASNSKWRAFWLATLSGFAQPAAALVGYLAMGDANKLGDLTEGVIYSMISGVMVFIALANLYPVALEYSATRGSAFFLLGMASMGLASVFVEH